MSDIRLMASKIVESILAFKEEDQEGRTSQIISPSDGLPMIETFRAYRSQDGKFSVFKMIGNRKMSEEEIAKLIANRTLGPLEGFRSKFGKPFSATLEFTDNYQVRFNFGSQEVAPTVIENLAEYPVVGQCPLCQGKVYATEGNFICENSQKSENKCKFKIVRLLLHRLLPNEQIEKLLKTGKTDLIERFRSKKTGKLFSAYLVLKENGIVGFEFVKKTPTASENATAKQEEPVAVV